MAYSTMRRQDLKLVKQIGTGGFSSVYKAMWKSKEVAAKRLNEPDRHEVEVLSALDHPNIVKFLGVIDEECEFFLILELCEGGSLRSYLNEQGERLKQFYDWAKQAGKPIEYLNKMKIIHKDVKSSNYLIANGNVLKLADFGSAKKTDVTITATGTATYAYMAPELLTEDKLSPSYDIFAYMVVIWELWTTQIPFEESEWFNIWHRVCIGDERLPIPSDMPDALVELMQQCWDKDRSKRPSIDHILSVLTSVESLGTKAEQLFAGSCVGQKGASPRITVDKFPLPWVLENEFVHQVRPGKLYDAQGIAVNHTTEDIAVADYTRPRDGAVKVYSNRGEYKFSLDATQEKTPGYARDVIVSAEGIYYVTNITQFVKVYSAQGVYIHGWLAISPLTKPSDAESAMVGGLTIDRNDQVLVGQVSTESLYINKHRPDGSHIASIKVGIKPNSLAVTSCDTIVICDYSSNVQIVDNTGKMLHTIHPRGHVPFWHPFGVYCYQDMVLISNTDENNTHEISGFSRRGEYYGSIGVQMRPKCITSTTKGGHKLLVTCLDRVQVYAHKKYTTLH